MPRLVGLAYASRLYRELDELKGMSQFSHHGEEVAFGAIGNASTAEGMFWEAVNAIGVLKSPAVIAIYDDGYGISVPNEYQMVKQDLSKLLSGFQRSRGKQDGFDLYRVRGWDYPALLEAFQKSAENARRDHIPAIVHVIEVTQPQGHSTSGSHERYKSKERMTFEVEFDCLKKFREWILERGAASAEELNHIEVDERQFVESQRKKAWEAFQAPILAERRDVVKKLETLAQASQHAVEVNQAIDRLQGLPSPLRRDLFSAIQTALLEVKDEPSPAREALAAWRQAQLERNRQRYGAHLYSESGDSVLRVAAAPARYSPDSPAVYGFEVLNACFDAALQRDGRVLAFGEDVGQLGDVNQGFRGLQEKYGKLRVSDTGIRETTILGQAIGLALRGLRPIAEIQYLDYILYALQLMSDDLATLRGRTHGGQKAPVIVRTRGHRLEGVWHSGSLMAGLIHLARGMYVLTPRNMTQAAGFYNTLLLAEEPAVLVEVLNAYRTRERLPDNIGEFTIPVGVPEILRAGEHVTIVTYGACCKIVLEAAAQLSQVGIEAEVIDVQTLLPFDNLGMIGDSLKKTGRVVFVDEDVPGGTSAYMLQEVLEKQGAYHWLDSQPRTVTGQAHRPAYGSDGDYFSKPNADEIFQTVYRLLNEADPMSYPMFF
jgi:pyruvate/2-oxoglutarate/acetoin dehydrogenase E1 component/TPP-dependent pyruvate/acetoin dehydrogenase alpha subunit